MTPLEDFLNLAISMAKGAGEILRGGRSDGFGEVTSKSSAIDIVTETDHASEKYITDRILSERPGDGILGEEGTEVQGTTGVHWVVDPLDGTVNFTYGLPAVAVSIAVEIDGARSVGVVYNPFNGEMFTAIIGEGAFLNDTPIAPNAEDALALALVGTGFSYSTATRVEQAQAFTGILPAVRDVRRIGSAALDLCSVACGRLDAYYELSVQPWDVAAGSLIASEAGAMVAAFDGGVPMHDAIAANPALFPSFSQLIRHANAINSPQ